MPARTTLLLLVIYVLVPAQAARAQLREDALATAKHAVTFLTDKVSTQGGYLWRYSSDLSMREGEGVVTTQTVWVQPPATPTVGEAFLDLWEATQDQQFLKAARDVGGVLLKGQMRSGGWQAQVELEPERRRKWAYRVDPPSKRPKDQSSLDDNKTQASLHFLIRLDDALGLEDEAIHEAAGYGLDRLLRQGQLPGGGFPQIWTDEEITRGSEILKPASYPDTWSRVYKGHQEYWYRYTLNDNLAGDVARVLIKASEVYDDARFDEALIRLADSLVRAQMPDPQPAWAQQYSDSMQPCWARKFEPPAITTSESFDVIRTLIVAYAHTGDVRYLQPIPRALSYFNSCRLEDGRLARFYELQTNRPLYFNRQYELTYKDDDLPTHYGFKISDGTAKLRTLLVLVQRLPLDDLRARMNRHSAVSEKQVKSIIDSTDERGAWVTHAGLRFHRKIDYPSDGEVIEMEVAVRNLKAIAAFLR